MSNSIDNLLRDIDEAVSFDKMGKEERLSDARNNLTAARRDMIALRRMLIQHPRPDIHVQELGTTLGGAIRDKIAQVKRLEKYVEELEVIPDESEKTLQKNGDGSTSH